MAESERWSKVRRRTDEVRHSLAAAHYHQDNVVRIERRVDELIQKYKALTPVARGGGHFYSGLTNRFSFEYHAFVFASTRCLIYLSRAVGRAWDKRCPSLKSLKKNLSAPSRGSRGTEVLLSVLRTHEDGLNKMFSQGTQRSIRDWIAHESFLDAGSLHIDGDQSKLKGILDTTFAHVDTSKLRIYRLSDVMESQLQQVQDFVGEMVVALLDHVLPQLPRGNP